MENALAKQREACSSIPHPFNQLELVHVALNHSVVLGKGQPCHHGCFVSYHESRESPAILGSCWLSHGRAIHQVVLRYACAACVQTAGPTHMLDRLRDAATEAAPAFLVRPPPVLQVGAATGTQPVGPAQEDVEADQEPLASSVLMARNGQAAYTLSCTDASSHRLPVSGVTPRSCGSQFPIVRRAGADRDHGFRIEGAAFVLETCHSRASAKR